MLSGVSLICFAGSYLVVLLLEISRLFFRNTLQLFLLLGFAVAGLVAHSIYLAPRIEQGLQMRGVPLANWYHWCLILAWGLAAVYLLVAIQRLQSPVGLFLLPMVLGAIAMAQTFPEDQVLSTHEADRVWFALHGVTLLLGTASVVVGFSCGVMYLVQSYRLKQHLPSRESFRLPSLEWLQLMSERSLILSICLLVFGLLAGLVLNILHDGLVPWSDPVIGTSGLLFVWLIAVANFNAWHKPARQGRKVAYQTVASFVVLALVLSMVLLGLSLHALPTPLAEPGTPIDVGAPPLGGAR